MSESKAPLTAAVAALVSKGCKQGEIARQLSIPPRHVGGYIRYARMKGWLPLSLSLAIHGLSPAALDSLSASATKRGEQPPVLARQLLEAILTDGLVEAVLDDGSRS